MGSAMGYPDVEDADDALREVLDLVRRPDLVRRADHVVIRRVVELDDVQARHGIMRSPEARRADVEWVRERQVRALVRETAAMLGRLFGAGGGDRDPVADIPASMIGLMAQRWPDGSVSLCWTVRNWRAAYWITLALLLVERADRLRRCPGCMRVFLAAPRGRRGRPSAYCRRSCNDRERQRRARRSRTAAG